MKALSIACVALLCTVTSAWAQMVTVPLGVGVDQRVRVAAPSEFSGKIKGSVASPVADTLFLRQRHSTLPIPVAAITEIEISRGRNRLLWGFLGATAGFFAGGFIGAGTSDTSSSDYGDLFGVIGGVTVGTIGGTVVGAIAAPERWKKLPGR